MWLVLLPLVMQPKGVKEVSATLFSQVLRKFTPKMQAIKRVLDLTCAQMWWLKGLGYFIFLTRILAPSSSSKNVQSMIEMILK